MGHLYKLAFNSGKSYIGITRNCPKLRFLQHSHVVKKGAQTIMAKAWRKYGPPNLITLAVIEDSMLSLTEQSAIKAFGTISPCGYNMTTGGGITKHCEESRKKISLALSGKIRGPLSQSHKENISIAKMGKTKYQPPHSLETREKISSSNRGRVLTKEHKIKISIANKGRKLSDDVKLKMSSQRKGIPHSKEHSENISLGLKKTWERRKNKKLSNDLCI